MSAIAPWLGARAQVSGPLPAIECNGAVLSYAELSTRAHEAAGHLAELGIRHGDVVALLLENGVPFVELLYAAVLSGAVLLPLNLRLTPTELGVQLREARARLLVHGNGAIAERARAAAPPGTRTLEIASARRAFERAPESERTDAMFTQVRPDSTLAVLFTSGTSGTPKGTELTHANFQWSALASAAHLGADPRDRWLACMPLFHVGGLSILIRALLYGNSVVVHERFDAVSVDRALDRDGVTHVSLVATMLARILDVRGSRPAPDTLRCVLLGGGPAPTDLIDHATLLGFPIAPTYGLTEAASQVATRPPGSGTAVAGAGLVPLIGNELRIVAENGRDCADGDAGELWLRGPTVMRGYRQQPAETASALAGGWLHTGDVAIRAGDGTLTILARRSDLIVSGGENVYPAEVEAALCEHPAVVDAAVAAVADPEFGQRPAAWLVFHPDAHEVPAADALRQFCRQRLAAFKVPVRFERLDALPRTASGKLKRGELKSKTPLSG
ncbi:MAG: o-succinylbenzoate--CoA ligase [Deltaproteobacteria bacterium]|nr:o-succinylbenzoate--CoA ligase [Deltaproteobacteria bacterium]